MQYEGSRKVIQRGKNMRLTKCSALMIRKTERCIPYLERTCPAFRPLVDVDC
jgi:hypothetical protein